MKTEVVVGRTFYFLIIAFAGAELSACAYSNLPPAVAQDSLDCAYLSGGVYENRSEVGNYRMMDTEHDMPWKEEGKPDRGHFYHDYSVPMEDESGFRARVYVDKKTRQYVVTYEGTSLSDIGDLATDADLRMDFISNQLPKQYKLAGRLAEAVVKDAERKGYKVMFTGHSLGGGLAQYAAVATKRKAYTFNAADPGGAIRDAIYKDFRYRVDGGDAPDSETAGYSILKNIINIRSEGDIVSDQDANHKMPGMVYQVRISDEDRGWLSPDVLDEHSIQNLIRAIEKKAKEYVSDVRPDDKAQVAKPDTVSPVTGVDKQVSEDKNQPKVTRSETKPAQASRVHTAQEQKHIDSVREQIEIRHKRIRDSIAAIGRIMENAQKTIDNLEQLMADEQKAIGEQKKKAADFIASCQAEMAKLKNDKDKEFWTEQIKRTQEMLADGTFTETYYSRPRSAPVENQIKSREERIKAAGKQIPKIKAAVDGGDCSAFSLWVIYNEKYKTINFYRDLYESTIKELERWNKSLQEYNEPIPETPAMPDFPKLQTGKPSEKKAG